MRHLPNAPMKSDQGSNYLLKNWSLKGTKVILNQKINILINQETN